MDPVEWGKAEAHFRGTEPFRGTDHIPGGEPESLARAPGGGCGRGREPDRIGEGALSGDTKSPGAAGHESKDPGGLYGGGFGGSGRNSGIL